MNLIETIEKLFEAWVALPAFAREFDSGDPDIINGGESFKNYLVSKLPSIPEFSTPPRSRPADTSD